MKKLAIVLALVAFCVTTFAQNKKISELPLAGSLDGTEDVPIVKGGANQRVKVSTLPGFGITPPISIANGGTGLTTLGTGNQLLRVNSGATALEYFTPSFITGSLTAGKIVVAGGSTSLTSSSVDLSGNIFQNSTGFQFQGGTNFAIVANTKIGVDVTTTAARQLDVTEEDNIGNGVTYPFRLQHTTSTTPSNGIGTGIELVTETTASNYEVGATIEAVATDITASSEDFDLVFKTMSAGAAAAERLRITSLGGIVLNSTNTAGGTTGDQTINKPSGTVNFAAAATTLTVTNSLVTTSSLVFCTVRTNDATAVIKNVVPGSGSFVITLSAAATAETSVGFFVIN